MDGNVCNGALVHERDGVEAKSRQLSHQNNGELAPGWSVCATYSMTGQKCPDRHEPPWGTIEICIYILYQMQSGHIVASVLYTPV
jgi:hypothetical protein